MKRILCVLLSILLIASTFAIVVNAVGESDVTDISTLPAKADGTNRYFFYLPSYWAEANPDDDDAYIYWWLGTDYCNSLPGYKANSTGTEGIYYYDVPEDVCNVIWSNGLVESTNDEVAYRTFNFGTEYYEPGESPFYPEGTINFDGMIYVVDPNRPVGSRPVEAFYGEWFYYYGNGEYGLTPNKADAPGVLKGDTVDLDAIARGEYPTDVPDATADEATPDEPAGTNRYYFYYPQKWIDNNKWYENNPYPVTAGIYWNEGTDACQNFPGYKANKTDVEGIYYYDVPKDVTSIIWNNFIDAGDDIYSEEYMLVHQTKNINSDHYEPTESRLYPKGVESFDGMIYVIDLNKTIIDEYTGKQTFCGEWFYYYGDGEYGLATDKAEADVVLTGDVVDTSTLFPDKDSTEPTEPESDTRRYYFYAPKTEWQEENPYAEGVGIYWWEGEGERPQWPGYEAVYSGYDSVYYYDVPKEVTEIIWTCLVDGGEDETAEIYTYDYRTCIIDADGYAPGENRFYPDGLSDFNYMIYVIDPNKTKIDEYTGKKTFYGEWYYYYQLGEYGLNSNMDDGPIYWGDTKDLERVYRDNFLSEEQPIFPSEPKPDGTNRYYFYLPDQWINEYAYTAGIYWWEGSISGEYWPGNMANSAGVDGVYYYDVATDTPTIIWNNYLDGTTDTTSDIYNKALQTIDIPVSGGNYDSMIFVVDLSQENINSYNGKVTYGGEWFYYYGSGQYGNAPTKAEADEIFTDKSFGEWSTPDEAPTDPTEPEIPTEPIVTEPSEIPTEPVVTEPSETPTEIPTEPATSEPAEDPSEPSSTAPSTDDEDPTTVPVNKVSYLAGDVDGNGKVNVKDVTTIQKFVAMIIELDAENAELAADVNLDTKINIKDATMIQKYLAKIEIEFVIGEIIEKVV